MVAHNCEKRTRRAALRSKHATHVGSALGKDDALSQNGVTEQRYPKTVTKIADYSFGVGVSGRRPNKSADPGGQGGVWGLEEVRILRKCSL